MKKQNTSNKTGVVQKECVLFLLYVHTNKIWKLYAFFIICLCMFVLYTFDRIRRESDYSFKPDRRLSLKQTESYLSIIHNDKEPVFERLYATSKKITPASEMQEEVPSFKPDINTSQKHVPAPSYARRLTLRKKYLVS